MQDDLTRLALLALQTPTNPDVWTEAIDAVVAATSAVSGVLMLADSEYRLRPEPVISRHLREIAPHLHALHMAAGDADDAPVIRALLARHPLTLYSEMDLCGVPTPAALPPSRMRAAQRQTSGVGWRAGVQLNAYVDRFDLLLLHMPDGAAPDAAGPRALLGGVAPVFAAAMRLRRVFEALQTRFRAIIARFDRLGLGTVLLMETGQVIESNAMARIVLDDRDGLRQERDGRLRCDDPTADARLALAVGGAWRTAHGAGLDGEVAFLAPRRSGLPSYVIAVHSLVDTQAEVAPGFACALCFIVDPARTTPLCTNGLALAGRLSAAEADVCARIVAGANSAEIATARGVSVETVRTQRRRILAKLGARDRLDLVRLAVALQAPLA
jgi:DNA-binding CsgD family transcriptional regulator